MKIKTGDMVRILAGKDKGKQGKVIQVFPAHEKLVVEGLNMAVRHLRTRRRDQAGQKIRFPSPLHVSNVQMISAKSGNGGRVGYKYIEKEGKRVKVRQVRRRGSTEDIE